MAKNRRTWLSKSFLSFEFSDFKLEFFVSKSKFCALNNEISVSNFEVFLSKSEIILVCVAFDDLNSTSWVLKGRIYKIQGIFFEGWRTFLRGGEMVSHGDSTVK